jgi:hypothetical protein
MKRRQLAALGLRENRNAGVMNPMQVQCFSGRGAIDHGGMTNLLTYNGHARIGKDTYLQKGSDQPCVLDAGRREVKAGQKI